jgi:hypothetical protein
MDRDEMERLFHTHREAERRRDYDAVMQTFRRTAISRPLPSVFEARAGWRLVPRTWATSPPSPI